MAKDLSWSDETTYDLDLDNGLSTHSLLDTAKPVLQVPSSTVILVKVPCTDDVSPLATIVEIEDSEAQADTTLIEMVDPKDTEWQPPQGHRGETIVQSKYHLRPRDCLVPPCRLPD